MLIRRFDRYWTLPGEPLAPGQPPHDSRPGAALEEGRLPFVSGLTPVGCNEFDSRIKGCSDLAAAIRAHGHPGRIRGDCEELFARMVFNIVVSNDDDHLRNHGFVREPQRGGWVLSPLYDVVPRPGVEFERFLHLEVGTQGKLATLDNAMSQFAAFTATRATALSIIARIWGEVQQWKTSFEEAGADGLLIDPLKSALRDLGAIASPTLEAEIRKASTVQKSARVNTQRAA